MAVAKFPDKFVVGFVGSLKPWHGIEILADAFLRLASDQRFHLLVVGDGPSANVLEKLERELPERVTRTGAVMHEDVVQYMHAMDVAVAPYPPLSKFYFSPLKILEYMAAGRAVVASDIGQLRYLIRDGETGILLPPGDSNALADVLQSLIESRDRCLQLGLAAATEAREHHTWSKRAAEILERVENDARYVPLAM
jgi:glycosyltransferase involved in cell wall biosynthesis